MNSEYPIENDVTLPPINLNSSGVKSAKSKSFSNSNYKNNENSSNDYAEAFNQISNAKFRIMTRLEKLRHDKAKNEFFMHQENNYDNGIGDNQREIYDNFNQVYSYLNPPNSIENGMKYGRRSGNRNYSTDFDNNVNKFNGNGNNRMNNYGIPTNIPYGNINSFNPYGMNIAPPVNFVMPNQPYNFANNGMFPGEYMWMNGNSYSSNSNLSTNLYANYLANLANGNMNNFNNHNNNGSSQDKVIFPKILMGMPVNPDGSKLESKSNNKGKRDVSNQEILSALRNLITGKRQEETEDEDENSEGEKPKERRKEEDQEEHEGKKTSSKKDKKAKNKKTKKDKIINTPKWWNMLRDFVHIGVFYNSAKKYSKTALVRNKEITDIEGVFPKYLEVLKKWQIQIQTPLWNEFKKADLNLSFTNSMPKPKFTEVSQKLMAFINTYIKNLLAKSAKNVDIPEIILQILFKIIKNKSFYPKSYLNNFELNRLDFGLNGEIKNIGNEYVMGMLLAFLVISKSAIRSIFLKPIGNIEQVKTFKNIEISMKFLASILHYIVQDAFALQPPFANDKISLFNYFRNYKIYNPEVEKQKDTLVVFSPSGVSNDFTFQMPDRDNMNGVLIDEGIFKEFMQINKNWVEAVKKYILQWSIGLGRYIKLKYEK